MTTTTLAPVKPSTRNLTNNKEAREAIQKLKEARKAKTAAEKAIKEASAILTAEMGDAEVGIVLGQEVLKLSSLRSRRDCEFDALLELNPEAYALTVKTSTYRFWQ